jgi:hypothetical protein
MTVSRTYTTRRLAIVTAIGNLINKNKLPTYGKEIKAFNYLKFFDDVSDLPAIFIIAGQENRQYQAGGYKDRYLDVSVHIFVSQEEPLLACEAILEDVETLVEDNGRLAYVDRQGQTQFTHDITILSISTDEGTLDPISIGEMTLRVHY